MKEVLRVYWFLLFLFLVTSLAHGQVRRDSTARIRFGTALPATCNPSIGSVFFLITPGSPLGMHQCLATDSYTPMVGSMSGAGSDNQIAVFTGPSDIEGTSGLTYDGTSFAIAGAGPHSIAGVTFGAVQLLIGSTFTSDGASDIASGLFHTPSIVGAPGDTSALTGTTLTAGITTQTATESIVDIAQLQINEPFITDNLTGLITNAQTVLINGAPTEGVDNFALRVVGGTVGLDQPDRTGDGQTDSIDLLWVGKGFETATPHDIDWKAFVDVTADDGTGSIWTLQTRIDAGGFVDRLTIADASSTLGLPDDTASIQMGAALDAQMHRDAADIRAQRRGANPQEWRLYDNFVSSIDYDRLAVYIGGGPPVKTIEFAAESSDATQGINILIESLANAFGDGSLTLLAGTSGARIILGTSAGGQFINVTGTEFTLQGDNDLRVGGLINSVGASQATAGIGMKVDIAGQGAAAFEDSHSIDLIGAGQNANRATWRTFVDVLDITGNSIWTLQNDLNGGGFSDIMTIDDNSGIAVAAAAMTVSGTAASFNTLMPQGSTPIIGLLLDSVPLSSVGQRDSDSAVWVGGAHDGGTFRSARWKWFTDITNNSGASTFRLQHSAAGGAFGDELQIFSTGEVNITSGSGALTWGSSSDVRLARDEANELGMRSSTSGTIPQRFNVYNNHQGSQFSSEYGTLDWISVSNVFVIGTAKGVNQGTARPMQLQTDQITAITIDVSQGVEFSSNVGFYGTTPVAQSAAYTRNATIVESRTLLASASATTLNNNNVLAALIADLQALGLLQ